MAVLDDIPGLTVEVVANGERLHEYPDHDADNTASQVTNYIKVHPEGTFEILCKFLDNFTTTHGFRVEVRLDGNRVSSCLYRKNELKKAGGHKTTGVRSKIANRWHESNFMFSPFIVDKDSNRKLDNTTVDKLGKVGTITVLLHRIKNIRWPRAMRFVQPKQADIPHSVSKFGAVPKRNVQALGLSHHGDVGAPQQKRIGKAYSYDYVDRKEDENAFATFHFKYRSLDTLKALRIVPRTPPSPDSQNTADGLANAPSAGPQATRSPNTDDNAGLSCAELIAIIGTYRGNTSGLRGLNEKELMALLEHHRTAEMSDRRIKREREDEDVEMGGCQKKRKSEVFVVDD